MPTRRRRKSWSCGERSHSRVPGPAAIRPALAGSGSACLRACSSAAMAAPSLACPAAAASRDSRFARRARPAAVRLLTSCGTSQPATPASPSSRNSHWCRRASDDGPDRERGRGRDQQRQPGRPAARRLDAAGGVDDDRRGQRGHRPERLVDQPAEWVRRVSAQRDHVARPRVPARAARAARAAQAARGARGAWTDGRRPAEAEPGARANAAGRQRRRGIELRAVQPETGRSRLPAARGAGGAGSARAPITARPASPPAAAQRKKRGAQVADAVLGFR